MKRTTQWILTVPLGTLLLTAGVAFSQGPRQSTDLQTAPTLSAEQEKQLGQLKQLEERLQKDREAMHNAITQYGWDSDQTDAAQEQLARDRTEYRKLRRSLRAAGVPVPSPAGMGPGTGGPGAMAGRLPHHGHGNHHCADCDCPCCRK